MEHMPTYLAWRHCSRRWVGLILWLAGDYNVCLPIPSGFQWDGQ